MAHVRAIMYKWKEIRTYTLRTKKKKKQISSCNSDCPRAQVTYMYTVSTEHTQSVKKLEIPDRVEEKQASAWLQPFSSPSYFFMSCVYTILPQYNGNYELILASLSQIFESHPYV